MNKICQVTECDRAAKAKSLCLKHYNSAQRTARPEYRSWDAMRQRCNNPKATAYKDYGGRGITACERWASFKHFVEDMGPRPSLAYTLDRIDTNGNYTPDNCRWATKLVQATNQRLSIRNKSGHRGVTWDAKNQRWYVSIKFDGRSHNLGRYRDLEDSAYIYDQFAMQLFGKDAATNFEYAV